jgi:hypothetical protein
MLLTLQAPDHDIISGLPSKWRPMVTDRVLILQQWSEGVISKAVAMSRLGVSRATFDRLANGVRNEGWKALVPQYKGVGQEMVSKTPEEFLQFWRMLVEKNQRCTAPAYRKLLVIWRERAPFMIDQQVFDHVPGYAGWPGWPNLPSSWNKRTLYRKKPNKLQIESMRQGLGKARQKYGPKVLGTRVGLWHRSHIMFDDVKLDVKMHLAESRKLVVPLQLGALELLSGCRFEYGMKPQLYRADGTRASLNEGDMRFLLCAVLRGGISARGTTMVIEHGTAAIRARVRDILKRAFGDLIKFEDSGMLGDIQSIAGMYDGRGARGNPNHKAALESLHNLIHNETGFLPAQTGHNRDAPEFLGVLEREHEDLFRLTRHLPVETRSLLRHRTPEYHTQGVPLIRGIMDAINKRTDHNLEGWLELGYMSKRYRLMPESAEWVHESRLLDLPAQVRGAYLAMADADARCWERKKLSPFDAFEMGRQTSEIIKVPDSVIAEILYEDLAVPRKVHESGGFSGLFAWSDQELTVSELAFEGRVVTPQGHELPLNRGETYETVLNPFDPSCLWVFSSVKQRGSFLGIAARSQRTCRADLDAKKEQWKRAAHLLKEELEPQRKRHIATTEAEIQRLKHNRKVITDHQQAHRDLTRGAETALANIFSSPQTTQPHDTHNEIDPRDLW